MNRVWEEELYHLLLVLGCVVVCTALFGNFFAWLSLGLLVYLGLHLRALNKLSTWLDQRLSGEAPESKGIWEDIFLRLQRFRQRNKRRHQRLVKRLSRFQEAAQAMPNAILILNKETAIEWCNQAATRMLGIHTRDDLGQRLLNLVRSPQLVSFIRRGEFEEPLVMRSPVNESRILSVRMVPYGDDQMLLVARDVTRVQNLEQVRRDFVANVSHEMRTPLTVINGYLEMLTDDKGKLSPDDAEIILRIDEQAARLQSIVDDLLQLSRLESTSRMTDREQLNVPMLLKTILDDARELSGEQGHKFNIDIDDSVMLDGSEVEIRSAFSNLVFNAVRYTPAGGEISIRWYGDDKGKHLSVKDSGIGIPLHLIPRLTERFYRVDVARSRHTGGTGLGLAIVKHVLQRHDGRLEILSSPGRGSEFRCHFPVA